MLNGITNSDIQVLNNPSFTREEFDSFVYFKNMESAMEEIERRQSNSLLTEKISSFLKDSGIPETFQGKGTVTICRSLTTPNIEVSRFLIIADALGLRPVFLEYANDKFTTKNIWKRYLGRLGFYEGVGKKGGAKISYKNIINFISSDGKLIRDVTTDWGEPLADFHHRLFFENYPNLTSSLFFDASDWFGQNGQTASKYYPYLLTLFLQNSILLENFDLNDENDFTLNVFLPSFNKIYGLFGLKPIIVALEPTEIEGEEFWSCQNHKTKNKIDEIIEKYVK